MKKISVLTPCYNGEKFIKRYFDSLLEQSYKNFEIIFMDDGSTDSTADIVKSYIPEFLKLNIELKYYYNNNQGQAGAINDGLKYVTGDYLIWPDSDDYYDKDAFLRFMEVFDANPLYKAVRGYAVFRDENDLSVLTIAKPKNEKKEDLFVDYILNNDNVKCYTGTMMVNFSSFKKYNKGLDIFVSKGGQNWQLILPILYNEKCKFLNYPVYNYLVRNNSHSREQKSYFELVNKVNVLEEILYNVINKIVVEKKELNKYIRLVKFTYKKIRIKLFLKKILGLI